MIGDVRHVMGNLSARMEWNEVNKANRNKFIIRKNEVGLQE